MSENHYYLMIDSEHNSRIHQAKSPTAAAAWLSSDEEGRCVVRKGNADFHLIGYRFLANGTVCTDPVDIIDLGPVSAHDTPLTYNRVLPGRYGAHA